MKYTNIYANLIFLLAAVQQVSASGSDSDDSTASGSSASSDTKPAVKKQRDPPPEQDIPRLITAKERAALLELIKSDSHADIVTFFKDNDLIDYPLIRFDAKEMFGYTPLAAAVHFCAKDTAKALAPVQFDKLWTVHLGARHSIPEIAAKHCPALLSEIISEGKEHPLYKTIESLDVTEITQILADMLGNEKDADQNARDAIVEWIANKFDYTAPEVEDNSNAVSALRPAGTRRDGLKSKFEGAFSSYGDFLHLIDAWISSNRDIDHLHAFLQAKIHPISPGMYTEAILRIFKLNGDFEEFKTALEHFSKPEEQVYKVRALQKSLTFIEPDQLLSFDPSVLAEIRTAVSNSTINHTNYHPKSFNKFHPIDPRIDTVVALYKKDLTDVEIVLPAETKVKFDPPNDENLNLHEMILQAYRDDIPEVLEEIINTDYPFWSILSFDDLRFNFAPFRLSPIKTAVMLGKPQILAFLLSRPNASMYVTTKDQLTALEMAACYQPTFLAENILPLISGNCGKRLRATNHVIGMFKDILTQICPTGAKNAPEVLKQLLTAEKAEDLACMALARKDYVAESFKHSFPADLIIGLHSTEHFKRNNHYLELAAKRGDLKLMQYFFSKVEKQSDDKDKPALAQSLVNWIRFTDGKMSEDNIEMLEFLLQSSAVDKNAKSSHSGATALSHAIQRSLTWIVKRLLLDPKIDVNKADSLTSTSSLQHALKVFHNEATLLANPTPRDAIIAALEKRGINRAYIEPFFTESGEARDNLAGMLTAMGIPEHQITEMLSNVGISDEIIAQLFRESDDPIYDMAVNLSDLVGSKYFTWLEQMDMAGSAGDEKFRKVNIDAAQLLQTIKDDLKDLLMKKANMSSGMATIAANSIATSLNLSDLLTSINGKTGFEIVPLVADLCDSIEVLLENFDARALGIFGFDPLKLEIIRFARRIESILKNIFHVYYIKARNGKLFKQAGNFTIQGIPHNVLLAHPAVDTTITDSSNTDALALSKSRAAALKGDLDAADEMYRAHVRVRNIDALHDGKKNFKRIAFGIVSTLFIGTVSAGLIKWMI